MKQTTIGILIVLCLSAVHSIADAIVDRDSLEFRLSMTFSAVFRTNQNEVALKMSGHGFRVRHGDAEGAQEEGRCKDIYILKIGDVIHFGVQRADSSLQLTFTNEVGGLVANERIGDFVRQRGQYLVLHQRLLPGHHRLSRHTIENRRFIIDLESARFYDVEKNSVGSIAIPFQSLWKNADDYQKNFSSRPQNDEVAELRRCAQIDKDLIVQPISLMFEGFQTFCRSLTNRPSHVVFFRRDKRWGGDGKFCLARVMVKEGKVEVLGTAVYDREDKEVPEVVSMFDECGRLMWYSQFGDVRAKQSGRHYEFDENGNVRRFVELDGDGRALGRSSRNIKEFEMVVPEDRATFFADMHAAIQSLTETWKMKSYVVAPDLVQHEYKSDDRILSSMNELACRNREKVAARNRERCAEGLPSMTEKERRLFLRSESRENTRRWFERLRHEITGKTETTAVDAMVDLERTRIRALFIIVDRGYAIAVDIPGARPNTLRELVDCRYRGKEQRPLLVDGENDIRDVWGREYRYHREKREEFKMNPDYIVLTSAGPDGVFDTEDDVSSEDWYVFRKFEIERNHRK